MESNYRYHGGQEQNLMAPPNMMSPSYQTYRTVGTPTMTSPMQRNSPLTPNGHRLPGGSPTQHMRQPSARSIQSSPKMVQIGTPQSAVGRSAFSMSPPPVPPPNHRVPRHQQTHSGRRLPSINVTEDNIERAYVTFILYANPSIPSSTDTSELRKTFRSLPRSDGKSFKIFRLWELIRQLENGELKTWVQLALALGVEPPSTDRGQSSQKIQQYAVRLKRWMHAMHIDAFFEYCLGKPHVYYTQVPMSTPDDSPEPRDGVPPEEDLAIRALLPGWKPKRGRKKASERESTDTPERPAKRQHIEISPAMLEYQGLESASMFPQNGMTWSAFPDDPEGQDPWGHAGLAITGTSASHAMAGLGPNIANQRWHRDISPSAYPQSAIEPSFNLEQAFNNIPEPRSAIAPNSSVKAGRSRRRNAPTVSSAWLPLGASSSGKVRGRPSASRAPQDTSTAVSSTLRQPTVEEPKRTRQSSHKPPSRPPSAATSQRSVQIHAPMPQARRAKLQLQVPQISGGPIRLATPPAVMINGPGNVIHPPTNGRSSADFFRPNSRAESIATSVQQEEVGEGMAEDTAILVLDVSLDDVAHSFAARILHGKLTGRQGLLSLEEATLIAHKAIEQLRHDWPSTELSEDAFSVRCATALGVSSDLGLGGGSAGIISVKAMPQPLHLNRNRGGRASVASNRDGVEYFLNFDIAFGNGMSSSIQITNLFVPLHVDQDTFQTEVEAIRNTMAASAEQERNARAGEASIHTSASDLGLSRDERYWRERCRELEREVQRKDNTIRRMRRRVFEVVMAE